MKWVAWICLLVLTVSGVFSRAESNPTDERLTQLAVHRLQKICGNDVSIRVYGHSLQFSKGLVPTEVEVNKYKGGTERKKVIAQCPGDKGFIIRMDVADHSYSQLLPTDNYMNSGWYISRRPDFPGCLQIYSEITLVKERLYGLTFIAAGKDVDLPSTEALVGKVATAITTTEDGVSFCDALLAPK